MRDIICHAICPLTAPPTASQGDASVRFSSKAWRALHVFGDIERLSQLLDTGQDQIGLVLMDEQLAKKSSAFQLCVKVFVRPHTQ